MKQWMWTHLLINNRYRLWKVSILENDQEHQQHAFPFTENEQTPKINGLCFISASKYVVSSSLLIWYKLIADVDSWQEWLRFADLFHFLIKSGCLDFFDFVDKLVARLAGHQLILKTNHVTLLVTQIIRVEHVLNALNTSPRKVVC